MNLKKFALYLAPLSLLATPACAETAAPALPDVDPALWVVKDPDTTIYLFGTFHALDGKHAWFNDEVKTAFDQSDEVVIEVITPENPADLQPLVMKHGVDMSGKTLTSKLSPEGQKNLAAALSQVGAPANALDPLRPSFAAMSIVTINMQKMGYTQDHGPELTIRKAAKAAGKPVGELETLDFQLGLFGKMTEKQQIEMLEKTLAEMDKLPGQLKSMHGAWANGKADEVALMIQDAEGDKSGLYDAIFPARNRNWADWIKTRLDKPGTVFMAVGAGHLAGKDSVQEILKARGIASARVPHQE